MESPVKGNVPPTEGCEPDFIWEDYLEDTNSVAAPPTAFTHVEYSLETGFKTGMKLEIPSSDDNSTYWIATVIMTCGELLSLRYTGYGDDRSADFWFDVKSGEFHPVGWCLANNKKLWPPKCVLEKCENIDSLIDSVLKNIDTSSSLKDDLFVSFMPVDQIKIGMKLEVLEEMNPLCVWIATIEQNVGGRLLLRYDGIKENSHDFWLFYLSDRVQIVGYGKENNLHYTPPKDLKSHDIDWDSILEAAFQEAGNMPFPSHIFEPRIPIEMHEFKVGMKLEAVNPINYADLCPATVSEVINDYYFTVTIDGYEGGSQGKLCCHSNSPFILPSNWSEENGVVLKTPRNYDSKGKFYWDIYHLYYRTISAPPEFFQMSFINMGFENGMKCEAVDPFSPNIIKAATILKIAEPLMFLKFDSDNEGKSVITTVNSLDIYPVGWCGSNSYPLRIPLSYKPKPKINLNKKSTQQKTTEKSWCPQIYFNHRCFTGPFLSKGRLAGLPQTIGPGAVHLVLPEVITRLVNIAYKSSQVLQILATCGKCDSSMRQHLIKAKYKGKSFQSVIEIVRNTDQIEEFCKNICSKLKCCPYLFGPLDIKDTCPSDCHTLTKTKFEVTKRGPGRKRKRKHWTHKLQEAGKHLNNGVNISETQKSKEETENVHSGKDKNEKSDTEKDSEEKVCDKEENNQEETQNSNKEIISTDTKDSNSSDEEILKDDKENEKLDVVASQTDSIKTHKKKLKHTTSSNIVTRGAKLPNFGLWHHVTSFHNRRGRPRTRPIVPFSVVTHRKVGRPVGSTKKAIAAAQQLRAKRLLEMENYSSGMNLNDEKEVKPQKKIPKFESSPLEWSVEEVVKYVQKTDCAPVAPLLKDQEIDGQAFLMLTKNNVQEFLHLKPEPAEKFCYLVKSLKLDFFTNYVT